MVLHTPLHFAHVSASGIMFGKVEGLLNIDLIFLVWTSLGIIYMICEPVIGAVTYFSGFLAYQLILSLKQDVSLSMFAFVHIFAWIAQFVGHGVFEGRAPALKTNAVFIFLAPFFVSFEILNSLLGYRNEEVREYNKIIEADIAHHNSTINKKIH